MDLSSIKIDLFKKTLHNRLNGNSSNEDFTSLILGLLRNPQVSNTWGRTGYSQGKGFKNGHFLNLEYEFKTKNSFKMARDIFAEIAKIHEEDKRIQIEYDQKKMRINVVFHDNTVIKPEQEKERKKKEKEVLSNIEDYIKSTKYSSFLAMTRIGLFTLHKNNLLKKHLHEQDITSAIDEYKINSKRNIAEGYQRGISMFVAYGQAFYDERISQYIKLSEPELFDLVKTESSDVLDMAFQQHPEQKNIYIDYKRAINKKNEESIVSKLGTRKIKNK